MNPFKVGDKVVVNIDYWDEQGVKKGDIYTVTISDNSMIGFVNNYKGLGEHSKAGKDAVFHESHFILAESKFNIGDKVKLTYKHPYMPNKFKIGDILTVSSVYKNETLNCTEIMNGSGNWTQSYFELVTDNKPVKKVIEEKVDDWGF